MIFEKKGTAHVLRGHDLSLFSTLLRPVYSQSDGSCPSDYSLCLGLLLPLLYRPQALFHAGLVLPDWLYRRHEFWGNLQFSLFIFNLSNMLGWYYKENRPTYRTVSYGILLLAIILWALFGPVPFEMRAFALVIHFFGLALLIFSWIETKRAALQQRLQEQNASINLLLAENERNRIGQDLHDTLGHVFAMLSVKAELVQTLLDHDQMSGQEGGGRPSDLG